MSYERGFRDGEQQAFRDRHLHAMRRVPEVGAEESDYRRGYLDGYTPRSQDWVRGIKTSSHKELA